MNTSRPKRFTEQKALEAAIKAAKNSPCHKSKRGVVLWHPDIYQSMIIGFNHPPHPFICNGSEECRATCNKFCVHAEMDALLNAHRNVDGYHMLHVKIVENQAVPSGPPSCWQCSRLILNAHINTMWLLHEEGLKGYSALEFHRLTLEHSSLPNFQKEIEKSKDKVVKLGL